MNLQAIVSYLTHRRRDAEQPRTRLVRVGEDRASTINHSALFLNQIVAELQRGRIPLELVEGLPAAQVRRIRELVETSRVSLVHLTEPRFKKPNRLQNSRAWLRVEPNHFLFRDEIDNFDNGALMVPAYRSRSQPRTSARR